ncbi:MAG: hypothetical protein AAGD32_05235 [Planctomycetota bacterium]
MSEVNRRAPQLKPAGYGGGSMPLDEDWIEFSEWANKRDQQAADTKVADEPLDAAAERAVKRLLRLVEKLLTGDDPIATQLAAAGWYNLREHPEARKWWAKLDMQCRLMFIREGWAADCGGSIAEAVPLKIWKKFNAKIRVSGVDSAIMGETLRYS